jgi:hypothetical protein
VRAAELTAFLDGVRSRGFDKWTAKCPAHPDKTPSLSIMEGERGVLLKCWAGCTLEAIAAKLGLRVADFFYDARVPSVAHRQARHDRAKRKTAQRAAYEAAGRRMEALREAEYAIGNRDFHRGMVGY